MSPCVPWRGQIIHGLSLEYLPDIRRKVLATFASVNLRVHICIVEINPTYRPCEMSSCPRASVRFLSAFPPQRRRDISLEGEERECGVSRVDSKSSETTPRELCRQCCWLPVHYDVIESSWYGMYLLLTYRCRSRIIALKARTVLFKAREYEGNVRTSFARLELD